MLRHATPLLESGRLLGAGRQPAAPAEHDLPGAIAAEIDQRDAQAVRADGLTSFPRGKRVGVGHRGQSLGHLVNPFSYEQERGPARLAPPLDLDQPPSPDDAAGVHDLLTLAGRTPALAS